MRIPGKLDKPMGGSQENETIEQRILDGIIACAQRIRSFVEQHPEVEALGGYSRDQLLGTDRQVGIFNEGATRINWKEALRLETESCVGGKEIGRILKEVDGFLSAFPSTLSAEFADKFIEGWESDKQRAEEQLTKSVRVIARLTDLFRAADGYAFSV